MAPLSDRVIAGDPRAIARAITLIEDEAPDGADLVRRIFARTGRAYLVGVTGAPGAGKSTLVDRLIAGVRKAGQTVGVVAVDPTSPFSGGAILGDRVRMQAHAGDDGVFIRSMATRGQVSINSAGNRGRRSRLGSRRRCDRLSRRRRCRCLASEQLRLSRDRAGR